MASRWYATKAAAERNELLAVGQRQYLAVFVRGLLSLYRWFPADDETPRHRDIVWAINVTGRSLAHVDRLARDWIAHGVAPTTKGGRGVSNKHNGACDCTIWTRLRHYARRNQGERHGLLTESEARSPFPKHDFWCVSFRFARAEARARRVVAR